jgi:large subunit ribosomal protein L7/L12
MFKLGRIVLGILVLAALAAGPAKAAQLSFVSGTIVEPAGINEGDPLPGGTTVKTGPDGLAVVEHRWPSDKQGYACIEVVVFGYGQSYTVREAETPGRCETTVPTDPGNFPEGEPFLAKNTRYSDAAFDDPSPPEAVQRSHTQWRSFERWMRNAQRTFTGEVVAVRDNEIRVRSSRSNRQVPFAAQSAELVGAGSLEALIDKRVRVDYKRSGSKLQATRIRLDSPLVFKPIPLPLDQVWRTEGWTGMDGRTDSTEGPTEDRETPQDRKNADAVIWHCTVDLHQGDRGRMQFLRRGDDIRGVMQIDRGSQQHRIAGSWKDDEIRFRRALSDTSSQPFEGKVSRAGGETARMAGRFARGFSGVWSAECKPRGEGQAPVSAGEGEERFNVVLTDSGENKISVIKAVRAVTGLGLREAKEAVESTPYAIKTGVSVSEARRIAARLQEAGGRTRIELQP